MLIGDQVLGMRRRHPADWRTNISLGAKAEPLELDPGLETLARTASDSVGTDHRRRRLPARKGRKPVRHRGECGTGVESAFTRDGPSMWVEWCWTKWLLISDELLDNLGSISSSP